MQSESSFVRVGKDDLNKKVDILVASVSEALSPIEVEFFDEVKEEERYSSKYMVFVNIDHEITFRNKDI